MRSTRHPGGRFCGRLRWSRSCHVSAVRRAIAPKHRHTDVELLADFPEKSREDYFEYQPRSHYDNKDMIRSQTIDIPTRTIALNVRAGRDVAQNAILADAVTVLVFIRAVDRSDCCRVTAFLLTVSGRLNASSGWNDLKHTTQAGIRAAWGPVCAKESTAIDKSKIDKRLMLELGILAECLFVGCAEVCGTVERTRCVGECT